MLSPGALLREAWTVEPLKIPGAFNALTAKLAERLGFRAVYLSGGALSAGWAGLPDIGLLSATEFTEQAAVLARSTSLPLLCDADTGFGEPINVARTIELFEEAGAAGIHLEDQVLPKRCGHLSGKKLIDPAAMIAKLRAAVLARGDSNFVIVARTDARSVEGFEAVLNRARMYFDAGADMIFPEALESAEEFAQFAEKFPNTPLLANMTEFGRGPLLDFPTLTDMGYRAVLYPLTAFRAAMKATEESLIMLRDKDSQRDQLQRMQTRAELYDLLGYSQWEAKDRAFFGLSEDKPDL